MRTLTYDGAVFDEGNGWIYRKIMNWTLPGLFLAAVEIGVINAGLLQAQGVPSFMLKLLGVLTVVYVIPSVFAFPTCWFLSTGRSRLYKFSKIDLYKKKIVYHKVESLIMSKPLTIGIDTSTDDANDDEQQIENLPNLKNRCRTLGLLMHQIEGYYFFRVSSIRLNKASFASIVLVRNFSEPPFWKPSPFLLIA